MLQPLPRPPLRSSRSKPLTSAQLPAMLLLDVRSAEGMDALLPDGEAPAAEPELVCVVTLLDAQGNALHESEQWGTRTRAVGLRDGAATWQERLTLELPSVLGAPLELPSFAKLTSSLKLLTVRSES